MHGKSFSTGKMSYLDLGHSVARLGNVNIHCTNVLCMIHVKNKQQMITFNFLRIS